MIPEWKKEPIANMIDLAYVDFDNLDEKGMIYIRMAINELFFPDESWVELDQIKTLPRKVYEKIGEIVKNEIPALLRGEILTIEAKVKYTGDPYLNIENGVFKLTRRLVIKEQNLVNHAVMVLFDAIKDSEINRIRECTVCGTYFYSYDNRMKYCKKACLWKLRAKERRESRRSRGDIK